MKIWVLKIISDILSSIGAFLCILLPFSIVLGTPYLFYNYMFPDGRGRSAIEMGRKYDTDLWENDLSIVFSMIFVIIASCIAATFITNLFKEKIENFIEWIDRRRRRLENAEQE
jgi:hypothetical protein